MFNQQISKLAIVSNSMGKSPLFREARLHFCKIQNLKTKDFQYCLLAEGMNLYYYPNTNAGLPTRIEFYPNREFSMNGYYLKLFGSIYELIESEPFERG